MICRLNILQGFYDERTVLFKSYVQLQMIRESSDKWRFIIISILNDKEPLKKKSSMTVIYIYNYIVLFHCSILVLYFSFFRALHVIPMNNVTLNRFWNQVEVIKVVLKLKHKLSRQK